MEKFQLIYREIEDTIFLIKSYLSYFSKFCCNYVVEHIIFSLTLIPPSKSLPIFRSSNYASHYVRRAH